MEFAKHSWIIFLIFCIVETVISGKQNETSPLIPCEEGWLLFRDTCYKVFGIEKGLNWIQAEASCSLHNGSLVTIQSQELQDFLTIFLLSKVKSNMWIGLHDRDLESQYIWEDGSVVNYTNWDPGEPSGRRNQQEVCIEMRYYAHGKLGMWNDLDCEAHVLPYICQSNKMPPAEGNESTIADNQHIEDINSSLSGYVSLKTMFGLLFAITAILLIAGFTVYRYKDHCRKSNNQGWKDYVFSLTSRDRKGSLKFTKDDESLMDAL